MQKETLKDLKETKEREKIEMNKMLKNKSGITLIALVVTIVILLILAGVSISLVLDNNGIINRSKEARNKYGQARDNEQAQLNEVSDWIDEKTNGNGGTTKTTKVAVNEKAASNGTINGEEGSSNNPTIPEGYTPINTTTSSWRDGSTAPTQDSVDHGLVIKDDSNNEWVWIPVDSTTLATMYETSSDAKTLWGTTVTTNKYSKSGIISGITRGTPDKSILSIYREPDLVIENGAKYDAEEQYYKDILGFESKEKMAEAFISDYNEMIASIEKYGGFYIGRYELSEVGVKKDQPTLTLTNWYNLYKKCKELKASNKVETRMIWGCQWDVTCNFIANKGDKKSITDSRSWGNYMDSRGDAKATVTEDDGSTIDKNGSKQNTGYSEYWKANNIYDLAGNCFEWTQEANLDGGRACRGGHFDDYGSSYPAPGRGGSNPDYSICDYLRFSSHFNNKVILSASVKNNY